MPAQNKRLSPSSTSGKQRNPIQNLDLNLLYLFITLWDVRSVTRASEILCVTQSAVSHSLRRLREALGDPLFSPGRTGLVPTARANELIAPVRKALQEIEQALAGSSEFIPSDVNMTFVLGVGELAEVALVPALLAKVQKSAPGVIIQTQLIPDALYRHSSLESGLFDAVLHSRPILGNSLSNRRIGSVEIVGLIRTDLIPEGGIDLKFYSSRPHIVSSSSERNANIDHALEKNGTIRKVGAVVQNFLVMATAAASTGYISHMPRSMAEKIAKALDLSVFLPPVEIERFPLYITWHERLNDDPSFSWLILQIENSLNED